MNTREDIPNDYIGDEYDKNIYFSNSSEITDFICTYKHEIAETISVGLHSIADAMTIAHMSGTHLPGRLKCVGPACELVSEVVHNPSNEVVEKFVCGSMVGLVKEGLNATIAVESAIVIGTLSSATTTPIGGAATAATVAVGSYKMANKITEPFCHMVQHQCHATFNAHRKTNSVVNAKIINTSNLTCNVATLQDGARIGQCIVNVNNSISSSTSNIMQNLQKLDTSNTFKTSNLLNMGFSASVLERISNHSNMDIVNSSITNNQILQSSGRDYQVATASNANNINLSNLSAESRPVITYTSMMDRKTAFANSPFLFSSCQEPRISNNYSGFFNSDRGNGGRWCDSNGNCYSYNGGGRCRDSSSSKTCETSVKF